MKVAVIGSGAIGCFIGAHIAQTSGTSVLFIGRKRIGALALANGIHAKSLNRGTLTLLPDKVQWTESLREAHDADIILMTLKSQDTRPTAMELAPLLKPGAIVISFQNGVSNVEVLREHLPAHSVFGGMVPFNVVQEENQASFTQTTAGDLAIDAAGEGNLRPLAEAIRSAGLGLQFIPNFAAIQWGKLIKNLNNSLNALSGIPLAEQLKDRDHRKILAASMDEALNVLRAANVRVQSDSVLPITWLPEVLRLPDSIFSLLAKSQLKIDPSARLSMWHDLNLGRPTEIDYLNGEIVQLAKKLNLAAPLHDRIIALVRKAEKAGSGSPQLSVEQLKSQLMLEV